MATNKVARRLAAIFAADMVGYSRLMEADEEGTFARQKTHRKELIDPKISEHDGRIAAAIGELGLPTVLIQEGGYHVQDLGRNVAAFHDKFERVRGRPASR